MRNDLTPDFLAAMNSKSRTPVQYLQMHFADFTLYISDRAITIDGQDYMGLVEDWGQITTAGSGITDIIAETLQVSISFWNGGLYPLSSYFLIESPVNVVVELYQTFEGLQPEDAALVLQGVIQDPITISEASRLISLDVVSLNMRYQANVGKVLLKEDYPSALESDINKGIDLVFGDAGTVQTLAAKVPLSCTQTGSILTLPTILNVHDDLDELGFPDNGFLQVDDEILYYNSRDSDTFNITLRGVSSTIASEHSDGSTVLEYINDHTYIIGQGPLTSVSDVRAGGLPVDASAYTLDLASDPATIVFPVQPKFISYSRGARATEVDFDATGAGNTAWQPHYAYDSEYRSYGAIISETRRNLAIQQVDTAIDEGEVVRAFLLVEHWETKTMPNDYVDVIVEGIGTVGRLSRPNEADITEVSGSVDIDHGHDHETGGTHDHGFANPGLSTSNPSHDHPIDATGEPYVSTGSYSLPKTDFVPGYSSSLAGTGSKYITFSYSVPSSVTEQSLHIRFYAAGFNQVWVYDGSQNIYFDVGAGSTVDATVPIDTRRTSIRLYITKYTNVVGARFTIREMTLTSIKPPVIDYRATAVSASHSSTGDVGSRGSDTTGKAIKDPDDVDNFSGANRVLQEISTTTSSQKVTDRFDLTKHLETISWDWFQGRDIQLYYQGSTNNAEVVVTYANFAVEYRQRQNEITNDITCRPVGSLPNRPDMVVQYLLHNISGVPLETFGSVFINPEVWDDLEIWDDAEIWIDNGEQLPILPGAYFTDAANRYEFLGYTIDGVISANDTVKAAVKEVCKQARGRVVWSAGKVKLAVREKLDNWVPIKELDPEHTQLKSITVNIETVDNIRNDIDLFYQLDRVSDASDEGQYDATASLLDQASIDRNGQKKYNSEWLFDLVRNQAMAEDLVDFYLWRHGETATYYDFRVYLQQFDLEKEDAIRLSSDFFRLTKIPLKIQDNPRTFGSGKYGRINTIDLTGEAVRQKLLTLVLSDSVTVYDESIDVGLGTEQDNNDVAIALDELDVRPIVGNEDEVFASDSLIALSRYASTFTENIIPLDEIETSLSMVLEDSVVVVEDFNVLQELCFGACGFGSVDPPCAIPFGSKTMHYDRPLDISTVTDEIQLTADFILELSDTATAIDDDPLLWDTLGDSVGLTEELIFNSCFGCPVSGATGFGLNNFGR